jgi:ABC-type xylose transport system permease subunit
MAMIRQDNISIGERVLAPTPKFFRTIRFIGLILGSVGSTILMAPVALPAVVTTMAGYLVTAGTVAAAVSQTTVDWKEYEQQKFAGVPHNYP